jgi:hypothetical protein
LGAEFFIDRKTKLEYSNANQEVADEAPVHN